MITLNAKKLLAYVLCLNNDSGTFIPLKKTDGTTVYTKFSVGANAWPYVITYLSTIVFNTTAGGIRIGSGTTPATENDYNLESQITSGLTGSTVISKTLDSNGNPAVTVLLTLTNTSSSAITVGEIGYFPVIKTNTQAGTSAETNTPIMLDRTVLDTPVNIPANSAATISYTLKGEWNSGT